MRHLLSATCLTPIAIGLGSVPLLAETVVNNSRTTPIQTSKANATGADDVRIGAQGTVTVAGGAAVTIDSNNSVKNEGAIKITGANGATGILVNPGVSGSVTNSGTITIDENYTHSDGDKDGDGDGPFAQGSGRYGIRVAPGGSFTGSVTHSGGTILVEGNDSAGIAIDSRLVGSLTSGGNIGIVGNDVHGIRAGEVTGDVKLTGGTIQAAGRNAVGVALDGDIGGALVINNKIQATGYRYTTPPADRSKLDADDLMQGGPAVRISGSVVGGIHFAAPTGQSAADITSFGSAAAVEVGAAGKDISVGAIAGGGGHGLIVRGSVTGNGLYKGVAANGIVIGGMGGAVNIAGGATIAGTVTAAADTATATALRIGSKANVPELKVTGSVGAQGGGAAGTAARAIVIDADATVTTLRNSGTIAAKVNGEGNAIGVVDHSGKLSLIENSGSLGVVDAALIGERAVAIDLRANALGATVRQLAAQGAGPAINGNILLGAGDDVLDVADGVVNGTTRFGAGANRLNLSGDAVYTGGVIFEGGADQVTLSGSSKLVGDINFGGGADTLSLAGTSSYRGALAGGSGLAVTIGSGASLDLTNKGAVQLASLSAGAQSSLSVNIDPVAKTGTLYQVAGEASFGAGTKVNVHLQSVGGSQGRYTFLKAGTLTGAGNLTSTIQALPFLFSSSLVSNQAAGEVAIDIRRKTAAELEMNGSQSRAYDAIMNVVDKDTGVAKMFLSIDNAEALRATMGQMLPDHAGGTFETVTSASRATSRFLTDPNPPMLRRGGLGMWLQQVAWGTSKSIGDTASYDISGWGAAGGLDFNTGAIGNFGVSLAWLGGKDADGGNDNEVRSGQTEIAAYWRGGWKAINAFARVSAAKIDFDGTRHFTGTVGTEAITRTANGEWDGALFSAGGGLSYEARFGRLSLRPLAAVDYYRLKEDSYTETGGGAAFDLSVDERTSDELAGTASVTLGYDLAGLEADESWFRVELEGGRRQILGGELGATTARFADGEDFTLVPEARTDGWLARLRVMGGGGGFYIGGEASAEEQQGHAAIAARATIGFGF